MKSVDLLYIPVPDRETGVRLARLALESRLAACGNVHGPMESLYEWEGEMQREEEWALWLKTAPESAARLAARMEEAHPYDCPCVVRLPATANPAFADWVGEMADGSLRRPRGVDPARAKDAT